MNTAQTAMQIFPLQTPQWKPDEWHCFRHEPEQWENGHQELTVYWYNEGWIFLPSLTVPFKEVSEQ